MEFTPTQEISNGQAKFSPNGSYIACIFKTKVDIWDSLYSKQLYSVKLQNPPQSMEWSPDSQHILFYTSSSIPVCVLSMQNGKIICNIGNGNAGCLKATWADNEHIITFSEMKLRIMIWSLTLGKCVGQIQHPKDCTNRVFSFTSDGKFAAFAERNSAQDFVNIFSCENWVLIKRFGVDTTDFVGMEWSPNGNYLAIWDCLLECKVCIYSLDGRLLKVFSPYSDFLGVKNVKWMSNSKYLVVSTYNEQITFLDHLNWSQAKVLSHSQKQMLNNIAVYTETEKICNSSNQMTPQYELNYPTSISLPAIQIDNEKPDPPIGVQLIEFSPDGSYLATKNDRCPTVLWIWSLSTFSLISLIIQQNPIKNARWRQVQNTLEESNLFQSDQEFSQMSNENQMLMFCSSSPSIFTWSPKGCQSTMIPTDGFRVQSLAWSPNGKSFVALEKDRFCMGFLESEA